MRYSEKPYRRRYDYDTVKLLHDIGFPNDRIAMLLGCQRTHVTYMLSSYKRQRESKRNLKRRYVK